MSAECRTMAFRYMGYNEENIPDNISLIADKCEKLLLQKVTPRYTYRMFDIEFMDSGVFLKDIDFVLEGEDIKNHLTGCNAVTLLSATLGIGADNVIKQLSVCDMTESFVADCIASALIEQVCDEAEAEIGCKLKKVYTTWRYSPGYGDFPIIQQKEFLRVTEAVKRIGLYLSDGGMLMPTKSVTAVIGLSETPVNKNKRGCISCSMKDKCSFRKRGNHCEF